MFNPTILGYYSCYRFVALPVSIITNAVGQVFYKEVNELKNDKTPLFPTLKDFIFLLAAAGTIPFILGFYLAKIYCFCSWAACGPKAAPLFKLFFHGCI